jgi:hypothetical protein
VRIFRANAQRFGTNGGDACGCRIPLEGVIVVILPALWLQVKTLDLAVSTAAALCVVTLLRASSFGFLCFSFLSLICFVRGSPLHLVSVRPLVAI